MLRLWPLVGTCGSRTYGFITHAARMMQLSMNRITQASSLTACGRHHGKTHQSLVPHRSLLPRYYRDRCPATVSEKGFKPSDPQPVRDRSTARLRSPLHDIVLIDVFEESRRDVPGAVGGPRESPRNRRNSMRRAPLTIGGETGCGERDRPAWPTPLTLGWVPAPRRAPRFPAPGTAPGPRPNAGRRSRSGCAGGRTGSARA